MALKRSALAAAILAAGLALGACTAPTTNRPADVAGPTTGVVNAAPTPIPHGGAPTEEPVTTNPGTQAPELNGSNWTLTDLNGKAPIAGNVPTLEFFEPGRVGGSSSCNRYSGGYTVDGATVAFSQMTGTMMACEPAVMDQEQAYLEILSRVTSYTIAGDVLTLTADNGDTLVFARAA